VPIESKLVHTENSSAWIKCEERMPAPETPVLAWHAPGGGAHSILELRWDRPGYEETFEPYLYWDNPNDDGQDIDFCDVTHWMPLPDAPLSDETTGGAS
jgi:hypothetical protein